MLRRTVLGVTGCGLLAACAALQLAGCTRVESDDVPTPVRTRVARKTVAQAASMAADYMVRSCRGSGEFVYAANLDPAVEVEPQYNVLRHAGAMYALGMHYEQSRDRAALAAMERAGRYLRQNFIRPLPDDDTLLAVWSDTSSRDEARLGGAGLALAGLVSLERHAPGSVPLDELRRIARFVIFMQRPDGSFYSKYIPSKGGRNDEWVSLYYPGEAALGLAMLYGLDPSREWLQPAADALGYLARLREDAPEVPVDHWALIATAEILPVYDRCDPAVGREVIMRHAVKVCEQALLKQVRQANDPIVIGAFGLDGRTAPAATRCEGLLAALTFLPEENVGLRQRIWTRVDRSIDFLMRAQVRTGEFAGALPRAIRRLPDNGRPDRVQFNRHATEVRIDYVQHALSALIRYDRLQWTRPGLAGVTTE